MCIKYLKISIITTVVLLGEIGLSHAQKTAEPLVPIAKQHLRPSQMPDRIIINLQENPLNDIGINWRTSLEVAQSYVEYAPASDGPGFEPGVKSLPAEGAVIETQQDEEPVTEARYHSVSLRGLEPGQMYMYRVGQNQEWSEWFQFQMPKAESPVRLLYFGDVQNDVVSQWSRVIREAYFQLPKPDFMLYAGDLINHEEADLEWGDWFEAGGFIHASVPSMMTPGNHEYAKPVRLSKHWQAQFNLPTNGPKGLEEMAYEVNFPEVKIISLDAEQIDEIPEQRMAQVKWLRGILENNPKKWTLITFHYPIYSTKPNRYNEDMQEFIQPLLEEFKVDLVLQGHDHAYARGRVLVKDGKETYGEGPMYVVSVSGPKMYDLADDPWMDRKAFGTQLFQWIEIEENTLSFKALTATGELYDAFTLSKSSNGSNILNNHIPDSPERLEE